MAALSKEQIAAELATKHCELVDASQYKNMASRIIVRCEHGHLIDTCLSDFRKPSFYCPACDKSIHFINPNVVPPKKPGTYRLVAFDQATEHFGLSVFDDGKLVYYGLHAFSGDLVGRLVKIRKMINEIVIREWQPDFIEMEDIQYQNNFITFKTLAMLLGVVQEACRENDVLFETVSPNVWRKYAGTAGKDRKQEKLLSMAVIKERYNIIVNDDVAEAILIGMYGAKMHKKHVPMAF